MAGEHKNRLRKQVMDDVSASLAQLLSRDRRGLAILLLQVINAVWFATLWERGFPSTAATAIWVIFFVISTAVSVLIEKRRTTSPATVVQGSEDGSR